jgi:predicted flap endonuclease-1-like 5' DNA nuclease
MSDVEMKEAPLLGGWVIAAAAGLVGGAVSMVVMDFNLSQAGFVGIVLLLVVGLILGLPRAAPAEAAAPQAVHAAPVAPSAARPVAAAHEPPAPQTAAMPMAAAVMSAPEMAAADMVSVMARRPEALAAARDGAADDLKQIKGVGPVLEKLLHSLGFYHFDQVAAWTAEEVAWVDENLEGFKGRVSRDEWVAQAKILAAGGTTEFSRRVEDGEVY